MADRNVKRDMFMLDKALVLGLRPDKNNPTNMQYLTRCRNMVPTEWGLHRPDVITLPGTLPVLSVNFPFPHLERGERITIIGDLAALYIVNETNWTAAAETVYPATAPLDPADTINAGGTWQFESFDNLFFMTNGESFLMRLPHLHATRTLHEDTLFKARTITKQDNRLVLGGMSGTFTSNPRFTEIFERWRRTTGGKVFTSTNTEFDEGYVMWSDQGGGAEDYPFATFFAILGLGSDTHWDNFLRAIAIDAVERGEIGFFRIEVPGAIQHVRKFGDGLVLYHDNRVALLARTEEGYEAVQLSDVGVKSRSSVGGTIHEHVYVDSQGVLRRLRPKQLPERLGYAEYLSELNGDIMAVAHDPDRNWYLISDGDTGYWFTGGERGGGLGGPMKQVATSLLRDAANGLVGYLIENGNPNDEQISNGSFTGAATDWTLGVDWGYAANAVTHTPGTANTLSQVAADQAIEVEDGVRYYVTFTISGRTAGSIASVRFGTGGESFSVDDGTINGPFSGNTTYIARIKVDANATNPHDLIFTPTSDFDGTIDNVSLIEQYPEVSIKSDVVDNGTRNVHELTYIGVASRDTDTRGWAATVGTRMEKSAPFTPIDCGLFDARGKILTKVPGVDFEITLEADDPSDLDAKLERIEFEFVQRETLGKVSLGVLFNNPLLT